MEYKIESEKDKENSIYNEINDFKLDLVDTENDIKYAEEELKLY